MTPETETQSAQGPEAGGGMLTVVAVLGLLLTLVQGTVYYRAKESAKFLGSEKNKVLAMQMAEAGIEDNVADFGKRKTKTHTGQVDTVTYDHKALEGGYYSSRLTTVAVGDSADTVDLMSTGSVGAKSQSIHARMRLRKHIATITALVPQTTTTTTYTQMIPASMPPVTSTAEYAACVGTCFVCHIPAGILANRQVLAGVAKATMAFTHPHVGDYVTDPVTACHKYDSIATVTNTVTMVNMTTLDTTVKVQFLSWK